MRVKLMASAAVLSLAWMSSATAQTATPTAAEPGVQDGQQATAAAETGEIIVTAQRRSESLQRVPVSVNVVTADMLRDRNINDLQQITRAAPSLQIGQGNSFTVRGVGTLAFQPTVDPAVAISLDEVSLARTLLSEGLFNDVAQVEVLNGPQGLLFGRNASAGLLNITSVRPKIGQFSGDGNIEVDYRDTTPGNGKGVIARLNVNMPVSTNSALRLNVGYQFQDPVVQAVATGPGSNIDRNFVDLRAKYLVQASPDLEFYVIGNYSNLKGTAGVLDQTYRTLAPGSSNAGPLAADGFTASPNLLQYKADGANFRNLQIYGGQGRVSYKLANGWELIDLAAYKGYKLNSAYDEDFTSSNSLSSALATSKFHQFSNELRVALPTGNRFSGQAGLYYLSFVDDENQTNRGNLYLPGFLLPTYPFCVGATAVPGAFPPTCNVSNSYAVGSDLTSRFRSKSYAAFGQFTYDVFDGFRLLAGGRMTHDEIRITETQNLLNYFVRFNGPRGSFDQSASNTDFSWKLGAQYEPSSRFLFYGSYAKGYKGPGANNTAATTTANLIVQPETSRNLEVGAKTSWLDRRIVFNVAVFQTKYQNYQSNAFDPTVTAFVVTNAARLTSKGVEVTTTLRPVDALTLTGAVTFLDSKFNDFPGAACYPGQPGCAANGTFNAGGLRTPLAPKFASSMGATYRAKLSDQLGLVLNSDWYHRSSARYTPSPNPLTNFGAIDVIGARASLDVGDRLQFSVFCKNCNDTRLPTTIYNDPGDSAQRTPLNSVAQGFGFDSVRTIGAAVGFKF